jgi:alginate O-acetyltransferase complex protein AlgI
MSFTSFSYLAFLALASGLYRLCPSRHRPALLLAISYAFYCTWSVPAAAVLAAITVLTYLAPVGPENVRSGARRGHTAMIVVSLLVCYLFAFKIALLTPAHGIAGLIMPLGISYYTFRLISYVLDVHWGKIAGERRFVHFAAYVAFFPQIVAGPIQRADEFFGQLPPKPIQVGNGIARIGWGLAKKLIIADNLGVAVNYVYGHTTSLHGMPLWIGMYLFPLQMYADFSGLTDIAIGTGQLFGITGRENFDRPFTATSISGYWRRWHMSLTTWLGDYLFTPLRMATRTAGNLGLAFSTTVNMVAVGLWHGLTGGYLMFGLLHSAFLCGDVLTTRKRGKFFKKHPEWNRPAAVLGWVLTFHMVAVAMVYFRAARVSDANWLLTNLWRPGADGWLDAIGGRALARGLVGYGLLELCERFRPDLWWAEARESAPRWVKWSVASAAALAGCAGVCLLLAASGGKPVRFLYEIF